jgi:hypothetical protein
MPFTVVFNDDGTIFKVYDINKAVDATGEQHDHGIIDLPNQLNGKTINCVTHVAIVITEPVSGQADPCIMQGTRLYCW